MYLQLVLAILGLAILLGNLWLLVLTPVCAWVLLNYAILPEEDYLQRKFGEHYLAYKRRVRRWI
jgi:protein-S-isoprenylcysteine O-methyltransferase Ste14